MQIDVAGLFKSMVFDIYLKKAISLLLASLVVSPTGFLGALITKLITYIANKLYPIMIEMVKIESILLSDEIHQKQFEHAQLKLKLIALKSGIDSQEFKDARKKEHEDFSKLIKFNTASAIV